MKIKSFFCSVFSALFVFPIALVLVFDPSVVSANNEGQALIASKLDQKLVKSELVKIKTRSNAEQKFVLLTPENPVASVILIPGGVGTIECIGSKNRPKIKHGDNFLIRVRKTFAQHGFIVAVMDAPSDTYPKGMYYIWRKSENNAIDIKSVADYIRQRSALPVWLVGNSNGTFSVVNAATRMAGEYQGIILTSSITATPKDIKIHKTHPQGILNFELDKILVPSLIVVHQKDTCPWTLPANADNIKALLNKAKVVDVKVYNGEAKIKGDICKPFSPHGFYGIEDQVVEGIATFIKNNL